MNHLNSIYQRLQSNYSDCDITYAPGLLTVKFKNGEIRADRSFWKKTMTISMKKWNDLSFICRKAEQMPHNRMN